MMIFGSRVRREALEFSDLDVILISPAFEKIPFIECASRVLEDGWALSYYTPREF
jgi:predicted nucleotidyltransferase